MRQIAATSWRAVQGNSVHDVFELAAAGSHTGALPRMPVMANRCASSRIWVISIKAAESRPK
jgi:hypothetical protein